MNDVAAGVVVTGGVDVTDVVIDMGAEAMLSDVVEEDTIVDDTVLDDTVLDEELLAPGQMPLLSKCI